MNTTKRMVEMLLRGKGDQFKNIMKEELIHRASVLLEKLYKNNSKNVLADDSKTEQCKNNEIVTTQDMAEQVKIPTKFVPETTYYLKDGNLGILNESEKQLISKLHEKLNNINKERLVKLLSESKESFNRILNLAKVENNK